MVRALVKQLALCLALLTASSPARAQKTSVIPLVPAANWRLVSSQVLDLDEVRKWGGEPAIEREYGVKSLERRTYQLYGEVGEAVFEQASDASAAYGLLTYYQTENMTPEKGIELTRSGPAGALMARGRFFIRVMRPARTDSPTAENDFRALLIFLGGTRPSLRDLASLPGALPATGMVPGSEKYLLGLEAARHILPFFRTELIGFPLGAEAQVALYLSGKLRLTVVAITYPTPQIARVQFGAMEKLAEVNQDRGPGSFYGKRKSSFVFLVLNSDSRAAAAKLLDEFKTSERVSWNERYPGAKSITLQVVELLLANLIFVFLLVGCAVLGGVLIVLFKRIMGKWFPESPWGEAGQETIIRLKLM